MLTGLHKLGIEQMPSGRTEVRLDGEEVRCRSYELRQSVDEAPTIYLELLGYGRVSGDFFGVDLPEDEVRAICKLMSLENLMEFVELWNSHHNANFQLVDTTETADAETMKGGKNA